MANYIANVTLELEVGRVGDDNSVEDAGVTRTRLKHGIRTEQFLSITRGLSAADAQTVLDNLTDMFRDEVDDAVINGDEA